MSSRMKEIKEAVEAALVEFGVARPYEFSVARNAHQQVVFHVKGIKVKYQFPASPSDYRAVLNVRSSVRKAIRTASGHALSGAPQQRSILDAGGLLPREPDHVGGRGAGVPKHPRAVPDRVFTCDRSFPKVA